MLRLCINCIPILCINICFRISSAQIYEGDLLWSSIRFYLWVNWQAAFAYISNSWSVFSKFVNFVLFEHACNISKLVNRLVLFVELLLFLIKTNIYSEFPLNVFTQNREILYMFIQGLQVWFIKKTTFLWPHDNYL